VLLSFDSNGSLGWGKTLDVEGTSFKGGTFLGAATRLALNPADEIVLAVAAVSSIDLGKGAFGVVQGQEVALAKLLSDGAPVWGRAVHADAMGSVCAVAAPTPSAGLLGCTSGGAPDFGFGSQPTMGHDVTLAMFGK
jgi:hypothetical protein